MCAGDIPAIRALFARSGPVDGAVSLLESETDQVLSAAIDRNNGGCVVAVLPDGKIIGCSFGLHDGLRGSFRHVAVDPDYGRQGIGASLLEPGYQLFRSQRITRIIIQVADDAKNARAFWIKQGFRLSSGQGGRVVSMTKDLG